jgi:hypothetical protein
MVAGIHHLILLPLLDMVVVTEATQLKVQEALFPALAVVLAVRVEIPHMVITAVAAVAVQEDIQEMVVMVGLVLEVL